MDKYLFFQVQILLYVELLWTVCLFYPFSFLKYTLIIQYKWDMSRATTTSGFHEVFVKLVLQNNVFFKWLTITKDA
jgi:hypothetical protein